MPRLPYPSRAALAELSTAELQAMCRNVAGLNVRSTRREYLISRIRSALAARAMRDSTPEAATDDRPMKELTTAELRDRYQEVVGRPTNSYRRKYLRERISEAMRGCIPVGSRTLRGPYAAPPEYQFFTLRFRRSLVERMDEIWPRLGFCSRMDFFRKALHEYFRQAGEDEVAVMLERWLQIYDDTTPTP
jgi:hypothetical protein